VVAATVLGVGLAAGILLTVRHFEIGTLDAYELSTKLSAPHPETVLDWPELRLETVLQSPWSRSEVLLEARWPGRPGTHSLLVVEIGEHDLIARHRLWKWCRTGASLSPMRSGPGRLGLRCRRTRHRVELELLSEDIRTATT
jgi:hypothetical protein